MAASTALMISELKLIPDERKMIVFINGGSGCGKSAFAEKIAAGFGGKMIYVATMPVFSEEDVRKVERHHRLRAGRGFETLERPKLLSDLPDGDETILIECMSTHTANLLFDPEIALSVPDGSASSEEKTGRYLELIKKELRPVLNRSGSTVFVSAEVAADGRVYDPETEQYKKLLTMVNTWLAEQADAAFEVVCGIPICLKGDLRV